MNSKHIILPTLLVLAVLLCACTHTDSVSTQPLDTDPIDSTVADTTVLQEDPFAAVRECGEEWLTYGLDAYERGDEAQNLKEFFGNPANLTYLTLYDHFFTYDQEKSSTVAAALFRFIYENYGSEALLDMDKRIEYKTAYLQSLGLDIAYTQSPAVETLLASMEFSSNSTYQYIIAFDRVTYYFKDFGVGAPSQYHAFLYYNTTGLHKMIQHLKDNGLDKGLDTERAFDYYMTFDGSTASITSYPSGNMYINDSTSALHEAVHAMGIREDKHIWLSEGICNYFGRYLGFNDQITTSYIQLLTMAQRGYFNERAEAGDLYAQSYIEIYKQYIANGGKLDRIESFDMRLYMDTVAKLELDTIKNTTLGEIYKTINKKKHTGFGGDLTYAQATSLVIYLADTYGIENVFEAYHTQDIAANLGKAYEELKTEWLEYLT